MLRYIICALFLLLAFESFSQVPEKKQKRGKIVGLDLYAGAMPVWADPIQVASHVHIGLNFRFLGYGGLSYSYWTMGNGYNYDSFSGIGLKMGPEFKHIILKFEGGLILGYRVIKESYGLTNKVGARIPYYRLHLGYRLKKGFCWGLNMNWVPRNYQLEFLHRNNYINPKIAELRNHVSSSVFLGFKLR